MTWKAEKWMAEIFPGKERIYEEYRNLPRRELAVVASAVLDTALAELLSLRLADIPVEYEAFLGLNEDGRAPCGSFGARIQLALLTGILTKTDAALLRQIKNIRNKLAHRVKADYNSAEVLPLVFALHDTFLNHSNELIKEGRLDSEPHDLSLIRQFLPTVPEAGAAILIAVLTSFQAYFHQMHSQIDRLGRAVKPQKPMLESEQTSPSQNTTSG